MEKRRVQLSHDYNHTPTTLLMALFGGACAFITVESIFSDAMESLEHHMNKLPGWQVHMGSACVGIIAFLTLLFILEVLETRSKRTAWRCSAPWLPLVGLTAIATFIHISFYLVALIGAIYGVCAYRRTSSVRRMVM
jgi:uncharacterized membrane protein YdcZ (DUF606 family)